MQVITVKYDEECEDEIVIEDYEKEYLPDNTETVIAWYKAGGYEGAGEALIKTSTGWIHKSLYHCSCYGPWDNGESSREKDIGEIISRDMTREAFDEMRPLFEAGVEAGLIEKGLILEYLILNP